MIHPVNSTRFGMMRAAAATQRAAVAALEFCGRRKRARDRAMALLREHLSDSQRSQFDNRGYFDVVGSDTGACYRIFWRRPTNVYRLDGNEFPMLPRCFYPVGKLPLADVLLAQKLALERFEREALAVARPAINDPIECEVPAQQGARHRR